MSADDVHPSTEKIARYLTTLACCDPERWPELVGDAQKIACTAIIGFLRITADDIGLDAIFTGQWMVNLADQLDREGGLK